MFYKKFPDLKVKEIYNSLYKIFLASLIMVALTFATRQFLGSIISLQTFWGILFQLVVSGFVGVIAYALSSHFLKSSESKAIIDLLKKNFYIR